MGFDRAKRNHFAGDLREPLSSPEDGDKSVVIDRNDVAGVVTLVHCRIEHAGMISMQIAEHHVRPLNNEAPARRDAFHGFKLVDDARHEAADGPGLEMHRCVGGEDGRGFGGAVAFKNAQAKFLRPDPPGFVLDLLRPGEDVTNVIEIIGMGDACVA